MRNMNPWVLKKHCNLQMLEFISRKKFSLKLHLNATQLKFFAKLLGCSVNTSTDIYVWSEWVGASGSKPVKFSLADLLLNGVVRNKWEHGKYVADPKYIASAWIHWPGVMKSGHKLYHVPHKTNFMPHFRKWYFDVNVCLHYSLV